jgi:hypothetical protein
MEKESAQEQILFSNESETMTFEKYAKERHKTPYVFEVENGVKKIIYFGAKHSRYPNEEVRIDGDRENMFLIIEEKLEEIKPEIVFVEGMGELAKDRERFKELVLSEEETEEDVIKKYGEPGYTARLGFLAKAEIESPEPEYKDEINNLLEKGFNKDAIFATYLYEAIERYYRIPDKPALETYLLPYFKEFEEASGWENFDYSSDHLKVIGKNIWGKRGKFASSEFAIERLDPVPWEYMKGKMTEVNKIVQEATYFRDRYMLKKIKEALLKHDKLFIVYGASHAYMQEEAIRKLMEST